MGCAGRMSSQNARIILTTPCIISLMVQINIVDPQVVVVPILSSIFIFPIIVLIVILCLKRAARKRRQRQRLAQRDEPWNERSCASIVQRSPPLSFSGDRFGGVDVDGDLATTVELMTPDGPERMYSP